MNKSQHNPVLSALQRTAIRCQNVPLLGRMTGAAFRTAFNWYTGGWPIWTGGDTAYLPSLVQDARWDANYVTRREMLRRMRYWSQNSALVESILSVGERYTVGASGLHVSFYPDDDISEDSDNSWYERAEKVVAEWFQECGWNGETMERLLKIGYRCQRVDGEIFYVKTRKFSSIQYDGRQIPVYKPVLQMVEAHRVETPFNQFDDYNLIDGVQYRVVSAGQGSEKRELLDKIGYWMRNGMGSFEQNDSWNLIEAENCFHIYNPSRVNMYRGLSDFYSCIQDLAKLEDLLEIEIKALDTQSVRAIGYESKSGAAANPLNPRMERVNQLLNKVPQAAPPDNCKQTMDLWRKETGAYVYGIKEGEKLHFDTPTRPSQSTLNAFELLTNRVIAGAHAPRCLVFEKISGESARSQGTEVRAQLDSADSFYRSDYQKWKRLVIDATIWFMEWAIQMDERVSDPPANWRECLHVHQPKACNVDPGYTMNADLMALAAGVKDYDMILGPMGTNAATVFKRLGRQQKMIEKLGVKITLPGLMKGQIPLDGKTQNQDEKEVVTA